MNHLRTILAALLLAAAPAAAQTIKTLGYNTTNGNVVAATNLTFTNSLNFATNARASTRTNLGLGTTDAVTFDRLQLNNASSGLTIGGMQLTAPSAGLDFAFTRTGTTNMVLSTNGLTLHVGGFAFSGGNTTGAAITRTNLGGTTTGNAVFTATNAAAAATAIGLGATNNVTFNIVSTIQLEDSGQAKIDVDDMFLVNTNAAGNAAFDWGGPTLAAGLPISFSDATNAAITRTNLGLGATNNVTFNELTVKSLTTTDPVGWALDAVQTGAVAPSFLLTLPDAANVIRITNSVPIDSVTNGRLGAFYYIVNQSTNNLSLLNSASLAIQGGTDLTLAPNQAATLVATGPTNASVAARGNLTDVTLGGTANTAPNQTASSGASLMTRDLVGQEMANPRTKMQTTYWFGLEGLGLWQSVNTGTSLLVNRGPRFGPSLGFYTGTRSSANAAGFGLRWGATAISGGSMWRPVDGGAITARTHVVNYFSATSTGNRAFGFSFAPGNNTNFWGQSDSFGLFWVEQPTNTWAASTAFSANDRIAVSNVVWAVATAGTTDTSEPVWTDLINSTVTNGTAVFRNLGPHTSNNWVLAIGSTNASQVVMTNTGKSTWLRASGGTGHEVLLTLRYGTNTSAPYTVYGSVADGAGQGAEVALNLPTNNVNVSPQYWMRYDSTNSGGAVDVAGIRYFSIDAELPPLSN